MPPLVKQFQQDLGAQVVQAPETAGPHIREHVLAQQPAQRAFHLDRVPAQCGRERLGGGLEAQGVRGADQPQQLPVDLPLRLVQPVHLFGQNLAQPASGGHQGQELHQQPVCERDGLLAGHLHRYTRGLNRLVDLLGRAGGQPRVHDDGLAGQGRCDVLLPRGRQDPYTGKLQQPVPGLGPCSGPGPAQIVDADHDPVVFRGLGAQNVTEQQFGVGGRLHPHDAQQPCPSLDQPGAPPQQRRLPAATGARYDDLAPLVQSAQDGTRLDRPYHVQPSGDVVGHDADALVKAAGILRAAGKKVQGLADSGGDGLLEAVDVHFLRQSGGHDVQVADRAGDSGGERGLALEGRDLGKVALQPGPQQRGQGRMQPEADAKVDDGVLPRGVLANQMRALHHHGCEPLVESGFLQPILQGGQQCLPNRGAVRQLGKGRVQRLRPPGDRQGAPERAVGDHRQACARCHGACAQGLVAELDAQGGVGQDLGELGGRNVRGARTALLALHQQP